MRRFLKKIILWFKENRCIFVGHDGPVVEAGNSNCIYKCDHCGTHYRAY